MQDRDGGGMKRPGWFPCGVLNCVRLSGREEEMELRFPEQMGVSRARLMHVPGRGVRREDQIGAIS